LNFAHARHVAAVERRAGLLGREVGHVEIVVHGDGGAFKFAAVVGVE
jgi:hypothetical protein